MDDLIKKTEQAAEKWAVESEPLWERSPKKRLSDRLAEEGQSPTAWVD